MSGKRVATVVEVDQTNFVQTKPVVASALRNAAFVSFDCEFTGLHREKQQGSNVMMSAKTRYAHLRQTMFGGAFASGRCSGCGAEQLEAANYCHQCGTKRRQDEKAEGISSQGMRRQEYLIAQVGISCFIWCEQRKAYDVKTFSFYISPRPWSGGIGMGNVKVENDIKFSCMGSSLKFLGDHAFDFNRWINDGIPFMSRTQYVAEREKTQQRGQYSSMKDLDHGRGFLDIWDMLLTSGKPLVGHQCFLDILYGGQFKKKKFRYLWHQLEAPLDKDLTEVMKGFSSKVRVIVDTKHMLTWYPQEMISVFDKEELGLRQRMLSRLKADLANKEKKKKEKEGERDGVVSPTPDGERSTKEKLMEERTDLLRRQSEMHDAIKHNVCKELQKNLAATEEVGNKFKSMHLGDIYKILYPLIQNTVPTFTSKDHDAGYDAYMTGAVFLGLYTLMRPLSQPNARTLADEHTSPRKPFPFANRIFIFAAPYFISTTATQLPPMEETHQATYLIEPAPGSHIEASRLTTEAKRIDPFSEIFWIEYQKKGVLVTTRHDVPAAETHKKLTDALGTMVITPVVKRVKPPVAATKSALPSPSSRTSSPKKANRSAQLGNLTTRLSQLQRKSLKSASPAKRKPRSPAMKPQQKAQIPLEKVLPPPPVPKRRVAPKRPPTTPPLDPKRPKKLDS